MVRLGVDLGDRRVGLAVCDALEIVASPAATVRVRGADGAYGAVTRAVAEYGAGEVVLGLPLHMNGRRGAKAREAEAFAERLRAAGVAVALWDERLTTVEAERGLREQALRRRDRRELVDAHAAQRLLASYLAWRARRGRVDGGARPAGPATGEIADS